MDAHSLIAVQKNPKIQVFGIGDTVRVNFHVREGERERLQAFQGVAIKRSGTGPGATFTVRRVTYGIGVERTFPFYSPLLESVEVVRRGDVRRAKLYYLRGLSGKSARLKESAPVRETLKPVVASEPKPPADEGRETPEATSAPVSQAPTGEAIEAPTATSAPQPQALTDEGREAPKPPVVGTPQAPTGETKQ